MHSNQPEDVARVVDTATAGSSSAGPTATAVSVHDHAWRSLTNGSVLTFSDYQCRLCGITWSL